MPQPPKTRKEQRAPRARKGTAGPAPGRDDPALAAAWQAAVGAYRLGRAAEAEASLGTVLSLAPRHGPAWHLLARLRMERGDFGGAFEPLVQAVACVPGLAEAHNDLGAILQMRGQLEAAAASYRRALELSPYHAEAHANLGVTLYDLGRRDEAIASYRRAILLRPEYARAHNNLGAALQAEGRAADAVDCFRQALAAEPAYASAHYNLGNALAALDRLDEAIAAYERALELQPAFPEALYDLGNALKRRDRPAEAADRYRRALALKPDFIAAYNNLAVTLKDLGDGDAAVAAAEAGLARDPQAAELHNALGTALQYKGRFADAIPCYRRAIELKPDHAEALSNLGSALFTQGRHEDAVRCCRQALALKPDLIDAYNNMAAALNAQGLSSESIACSQRAVALAPDRPDAYNNLGGALGDQGRFEEAYRAFRRALELKPDFVEAHSNLLFFLNYDPAVTREALFAEHRAWAARHVPPSETLEPSFANTPEPGRRLRLGYVSPDFREHSVRYFLEPLIAARDRSAVELTCYAEVRHPDKLTARFEDLADRWRSTTGMDDRALAELVRADGIDILVDLAGHTAHGRLGAFALKPAPVEAAWLGYPNTTGLATVDYRVTDAVADPPGTADATHTETLVRLPHGFLCYRPPEYSPAVAPLPARGAGRITFASFNNLAKVTPDVVRLWARLVAAVPGSRLLLKARQLADPDTAERFSTLFEAAGLGADRLELAPWIVAAEAHLALYDRVDIALDPFPYNGTTTTCEALWMGVPVVALRGDRHAGRVGASLLTAAGLETLIAETPEDYVARAASLAGDLDALAVLRAGLRERLAASPLTDAAGFAKSMEAAYRVMWRRWCKAAAARRPRS